jgi:polyketide synthase 12
VAVATAEAPPPPALPFVLSGFTVPALRAQAEKLSLHLGMNIADRFVDVAYSLACTRTHFRKRLVLFAKDKAELLDVLASYARTGEKPAGATSTADERAEQNRIALLFTGQGSQLPGMGRGLYAANAVFRQSLDAIAAHFSGLEQPLLDVMWGEAGSAQAALLNRTDFTQPALFALEVSLWRVWESLGVQPDFLLGHSIGELAAAHVAGVFDLADACRLVAARGRLMQALPAGGAMASLEASGAEVEAALQQQDLKARVAIAGLNAPQQTVVSGDADGIERIVAHFAGLQRKAKQLTVSHAFHSHLMEPMLAQFHAVAASIGYSAPTMTLVSSLTGQLADPAEITQAHYWVSQAREAVRFNDGMRTLHAQGVDTYLELGPQAVLSGMGAACLADDAPVSWIASLGAGKDDVTVMQKSMAELHVLGTALDWRAYFAPFGAQRVALPSYAFQRERYWFEPMAKNEVGAGLRDAGHQLLGGGVRIAGTDLTMFTTAVAADEPVWVQEHQVMEAVLMPGTAFFEAMRAAGNAGGKGGWDAAEVIILAPLVLTPGVPVRMQVSLGAETNGARPVQVYSSPVSDVGDEAWQLHAEGKLVAAEPARHASVTVPPRGAEAIDVSSLYADLAELGYGYGPTFQGIRQAWHADDVVWAHASLPESVAGSAIRYGLHPALLDSAMHALLLTQRLRAQASDDLYVPFEVERLTLWREGLSELWVAVAEFEMGEGEFWASLDLYDAHGACVGRLHRLHARRVDRAALRRLAAAGIERFHFDMAWRAVDTKGSLQAGLSGTWGLMQDGPVEWVDAVRGSLAAAGAELVDIAQLSEAASFDGVVCLWGANPGADVAAQTHDMAARALAQLQSLASAGFQAPVVWVTRGAVGTDSDDRVADIGCGALWGLMRTARNEHPELSLRIVDLGEEPGDLDALPAVLALEGEPECAVRRGQVLAARLEKATAAAGLVLPADGMWRLDIATKGRLDLPLVIKTLADEPLGAGEIRAAVMATGVNFLDVLNALGMVEIPALGFEFAGVVSAVGASVKGLKAGDAILGLARGSFGSVVVADARQVVRMPDNLSFEEAATIPMTFLTAWYGLHDLGAMRAGERVLIHAAAGGVGMAAVQLARLHGAEVFGTASDAKWDALRALGLDDAHIASSRNLAFVDSFNQTTGGQRFDIVLNSLAREFIDASLAMLGKGGRFLEMGKIDLREQSWIDAHHPGVSYQVYNLPEAGPERIQQMLLALAGLFAEGKLKPLPVRTFPINCASDALRFMAQARHVGKVVLVPPRPRRLMMAEGAVLVTGGTGGLGRYVAKWLATQHHVKDLVLTSRSGERSPEAQAIIAELAELGATATVLACDAADNASLQAVMAHFTAQRPLRGVVHAAGVLDDGMLTSMTPQRLDQVFAPKVDGGWNLHLATQDLELDFFVLFSSISGVTGTPGQANYAAANTFLDALAYYRRARGLPATSVAWGAWDGQGMATRLSEADRMRFSRQGMDALTLAEGVQLLEAVVLNGKPMAVAAALDLGRLQKTMEEQTGQAPALYRNLFRRAGGARTQGAAGGGANLRKALGEAPADQHEAIVLEMVRAEVAKALEFGSPDEVDVGLPLQDIGIDSLTAVLLRNQLSDMSGLALPAKIAFDHPNLRSLGKFMLSKLQEAGLVGGAAAAEVAPVEASAPKRVDDKLARQGCLAPELQFGNAATALRAPGAVFLTGATGFVGAFVLHELLKAKVSVHCLVRAPDAAQASARLQQTLEDYGHWEDGHAHLLHPVVGDLSLPLFGLPEDEFDRLAGQVDAICHSGALVDWMQPLDAYLGPNVVGTHEVLRLASRGRGKAVHFISSVATLPKHLGYAVSKDDREYGYLTSKWMAEQMVSAARRRGALASVYRLPFVGAAAGSGHFRLDQGDFLHNLIVGCIGIGSFPALDIGLGAVLPVDYLSRTVVTAMTQDLERIGKDYDFVNPAAPDFGRFAGMINAAGCEVAMLPYAQWQAKALQYAKAHKASALARIAAVLDGMDQADVEMLLTGFPPGPDVLGGKDYPCPAVNAESVQRYVDRIVATVYPPEQKIA